MKTIAELIEDVERRGKPDEPAPPAKIGDLTDWIVAAASPAFAWIGPNRVSPTEPPPPADPEPPAQSWRDRPPLL